MEILIFTAFDQNMFELPDKISRPKGKRHTLIDGGFYLILNIPKSNKNANITE